VSKAVAISERLARLGLRKGAASVVPPRPRGPAIEELVAGEVVETEVGACFRVERAFGLDSIHGSFPLGSLLDQSPQAAAGLTGDDRLAELDYRGAAFLDTETTGLSRGTGTYVFLVGIGYLAGGAFHVTQFFMRGLEEEPAMLQVLSQFLDRFEAVISFNGRAFDLPLLRTRFALARMALGLSDLPHFDLLFPARRLWRERLDSCALGALETEILGVRRGSSDVPSWQIPALYADYLRTGDGRQMAHVLYHNSQDVLSMVVLAAHMCQLFADPWTGSPACATDLYSLGRIYESLSLQRRAERAYRAALQGPLDQQIHDRTLHRLSFLLKRQNRREEACELWWQAMADGRRLYPYVELAKHYEWQLRNWPRAAEVTREALDRVKAALPSPQRRRVQPELEHRLARLERKMARSGGSPTDSPCPEANRGT
jgi:uncharacterized protein YprB with RNaseH-like and TPR domain